MNLAFVIRHFVISAASLLSLGACTVHEQSVIPRTIVSSEASFDGNYQNSGIVKFDDNGFIVTSHWIERYDGMLSKFGDRFTPAVNPGDRIGIESITPTTSRVTNQVLVRFTRMNQWRKAEAGP